MRRAAALALVLVPAAVTLAACGGDDELVVATPAAVAAAGDATIDAGTAAFELELTLDLGGLDLGGALPGGDDPGLDRLDGPLSITGQGQIDFAGGRSTLELDLSGLADALGSAAGGAAAGMGALLDDPVRTVQDGDDVYLCAPLFAMLGGECIHLGGDDAIGGAGSLFAGGGIDPGTLLRTLAGTEAVEEVGREEVVGVETTHLRGTFTLAAAVAQLPDDVAARVEAAFASAGADDEALAADRAFDVWIDDDQQVCQLRLELELGSLLGAEAGSGTSTVELRYTELGVDVEIDVPDDAVEAGDLPGFGG